MSDQTTPETTAPAPATPQAKPADSVAETPAHFGVHFKALMDKEKQLRDAEMSLKEKERFIHEAEHLRTLARTNPAAFMATMGITEAELKTHQPDPLHAVRGELNELKQTMRQYREQEEARYHQQALEQSKQSVKNWIRNQDEFKAIKALGVENMVFDRIKSRYDSDGTSLSEVEAAREVEKELSEIYKKLHAIHGAPGQAPKAIVSPPQPQTLTNQQAATMPPRMDNALLNREQSILEAAKLLQWDPE